VLTNILNSGMWTCQLSLAIPPWVGAMSIGWLKLRR